MAANLTRLRPPVAAAGEPRYELRVRQHGPGDPELEVYQLRSPATPHITEPVRIAGLRGATLELFEHRLQRLLRQHGIRLMAGRGPVQLHTLPEALALVLGLLFRTLAPMRNRDNMRLCADGIEKMGREEAAYWLGMAMHRKNPRRVLHALRLLMSASEA